MMSALHDPFRDLRRRRCRTFHLDPELRCPFGSTPIRRAPDLAPEPNNPTSTFDPVRAAALEVFVHPRLAVDDAIAAQLEYDVQPMVGETTAFMTSNYDHVLAAGCVRIGTDEPFILVRAATGDEVAALLRTGDDDGPESARREITWQATQQSEQVIEAAVVLWTGEVLFNDGTGAAGPFYTRQMAARAWAFSNALLCAEAEVFGAQVVEYACAKSQAAVLLDVVESEADPARQSWIAPVRALSIQTVALPESGSADARDGGSPSMM